jgi:hypothetical protein
MYSKLEKYMFLLCHCPKDEPKLQVRMMMNQQLGSEEYPVPHTIGSIGGGLLRRTSQHPCKNPPIVGW